MQYTAVCSAKTMEKRADIKGEKSRYNLLSQNTLHTIVLPEPVIIHTELKRGTSYLDVADIQQTRQGDIFNVKCFNILRGEDGREKW